jgi:Flp pilus assembly protein TadG
MRSFASDRSGAFAMMFAFCAVPVLIALGCSIDYVQALNAHRRMQTALDAALIAAVKDVGTSDDNALKSRIADWLSADSTNAGAYVLDAGGIQIDRTDATISASVSTTVPTTFMKIAGINQIPVSVASGVAGGSTITKSAFSMYLVLDHSQSMSDPAASSTGNCRRHCTKTSKIEALKLAVTSLTTQLATADPTSKYVRMAAVSYNGKMDTPTPLAWGESAVQAYVQALTPRSSTDSSEAMETAYDTLTAKNHSREDIEDKIHFAKNGVDKPAKYIVFMTDGENTMPDNPNRHNDAADASTRATCDAARANGVTVYTIAFMAPDIGQALLKYCATTPDDYFDAQSTADIVDAFSAIGETSSNNLVRLTQ